MKFFVRAQAPAGVAIACAVAAFWSAPLFAQGVSLTTLTPEQTIQEGLRRQEERGREQQKALEPRADELKPDAGKAAAPEYLNESPCFTINEFTLTGPDAARFGWLLDAAMPYLRRCIGVKGLSHIASVLDQRLRDRGLATTRVALPAQNLQSGRLAIQVEAGRIADIRMVKAARAQAPANTPANEPDERWGTWRNAFPLSAGDMVDVRDLEQGVENMKRLPSQNVATRLEPGDEPGSSIVFIERQTGGLKERVRGGLTLDNSGGSSLGRAQLSANAALDNPSGLNDLLSVAFNTNLQQPTSTHRSQSASVNYSVPWGYSLLSLNATNSRFAQYVQGTTVRFLSSGRSQTADATLSRIVWRSSSSKLGLHAGVSTRSAVSYLDDVEVVVQRRRTTNFETGANFKHLFEAASLDLDLAYRRGVPWQGAQDDLVTASAGGTTLRPRIWTFSSSFGTAFNVAGRPLQYSLSMRGQHTRDTTLSVDQISIGGRSSVRGFDGDAVLLAENGVVVRNELATPVKPWDGLDGSAFVGFDYGRVWGPSDVLLAGNRLMGLALGMRGRMGSRQFEATLAMPLFRPMGFQSRNFNLYVTLTQEF